MLVYLSEKPMTTKNLWKTKYKSLKEYYLKNFDQEFYHFDAYQLSIDPEETLDYVEKYSIEKQEEEIVKCADSFAYFCQKYIKILHPTKGLIPFMMYKYQDRTIKDYENHRFNIISKFRQGGLTTVSIFYGLWKCMFQLDQQIMALSKTDREATVIGYMVDRAIEHMPTWMKPKKDGKWNDHLKQFPDTGGALQFYSPEAARGKSVTFLIIDEAAFIPDMDKHWKAMWPVLSTGGSCVLVSTVNGLGNWYEETYTKAKDGKNMFHIIDLDYWEHPDYSKKSNPQWVDEQLSQLGEKGFAQEVLRSFLGSGETYVPSKVLVELQDEVRKIRPTKKLFPRYANKNYSEDNNQEIEKGALWIWKQPIDGQEYILSVDSAEGVGEEGDNSCVQVLNVNSLEQCAEFYSNLIAPHDLANVVHELANLYNTALIIVEDMATGGIILNILQNDLYYENIYYSSKNSKTPKPGIKITTANRPIILQEFQSRVINKSLKIKSIRLIKELNTFEYNTQTRKAQAAKGKHDDAVMAMALAVHARTELVREAPIAIDGNSVDNKVSGLYDIRNELKSALDNYIKDYVVKKDKTPEEYEQELIAQMYRKNDRILKEFGWIIAWISFGIGFLQQ
jgi:hypothetical protein